MIQRLKNHRLDIIFFGGTLLSLVYAVIGISLVATVPPLKECYVLSCNNETLTLQLDSLVKEFEVNCDNYNSLGYTECYKWYNNIYLSNHFKIQQILGIFFIILSSMMCLVSWISPFLIYKHCH